MTQEDKDLLLKDLCARLPYGVKCHFKYGSAEGDVTLACIDNNVARFEYGWYGRFHVSIDANYIKPYLRPMSSMTEEEKEEYKKFDDFGASTLRKYEYQDFTVLVPSYDRLDWLLSHHFDFRYPSLISKGLAIEVTKENNPYKE